MNVENNSIKIIKCEKLLSAQIDYKLAFSSHIDEIYKKAGQKMNALSRIVLSFISRFKLFSFKMDASQTCK